jgi:hypothetical protein
MLFWASYAWVTLACQFASVAYIFVKNSTTNYFRTKRQVLNAFWISSIQDTRPELTALQWIQPMATWHPLQSSVLDDKVMCEFTISLLDSKPPFEGLIEGLFENAPKFFWHCCDICEQPKKSCWIENITSFNMMCVTSNISERIAAESRPEIIHWILNIMRIYVFESR